MIKADYTAERLARVDVLLLEATRTKASIDRPNPVLAQQLIAKLDDMLKELRSSDPVRSKMSSRH
jgi:hypothetical protein